MSAQEVEFNYEGLVKIDGIPYSGPGYFKFAIVNQPGDVTLWANDGAASGGVEPATAVVVDVVDGVFNAIIGDSSTANMEPLAANIFNVKEKIFLRVWFSDNPSNPFERLVPDRAITNPALLGSQLFSKLDIYVDPLLGDDRFPGHRPSHPKRTIQAAWNSLPAMIKENVTIHLADGVYREAVDMRGKSIIGDATISIIGNPGFPDSVRVTGADPEAETTPVREIGFNAVSQTHLYIEGIRFDGFYHFGIMLNSNSSAEIRHCIFMDNRYGVRLATSGAICSDCTFTRSVFPMTRYPTGFVMGERSTGTLKNCAIFNLYHGVRFNNSYCCVRGCIVRDNAYYGFFVEALSQLYFDSPQTTISNNQVAVYAKQNSVVTEYSPPQYVGNGTIMTLISGAVRD